MNLGDGFHQNNGTFTAPKSGVYRFFFQISFYPIIPNKKNYDEEKLLDSSFAIMKNGKIENSIDITGFFISSEFILHLEKLDNISLRDNNAPFPRTIELINADSFWFSGCLLN